MALLELLREELIELKSLQIVTGAYSDIAAIKITGLRKAFDENTIFYEQISQLYHSVRVSAYSNKYYRKGPDVPQFRPKTVRVALTSNHGFYGSINRDIMERFLQEGSSIHEDRLIIGLTGKEYLSGKINIPPCNFLIFQKDTPPKVEVEAFMNTTSSYDRVFVYYPRFINMLTQTVDVVDIAYFPKETKADVEQIKYIFEPELPKILDFFRLHIKTLLFNRVLLETRLARTATRLISMDTAERNATDRIKSTQGNLIKAKQSITNRRLLETFAVAQQEKNTLVKRAR